MKPTLILIFLLLLQTTTFAQVSEHRLLVGAPKEATNRYAYLPFEIPAGTKSFTLTYEYDRKNGANVLDLGVFDSNFDGSEQSIRGFRGWSGGRRGTIFISEDAATNGYLPGKLPSGTWRVILGIYKVVPEGVEVKVTAKLNEIDVAAAAERLTENAKPLEFPEAGRIAPVSSNGYVWYRGDLHMHTFHSDGHWTLKGLLNYAQANNLDFIGITEHNTTAHHPELNVLIKNNPDLLVLRGEEVTTYGGHFNVWGLPDAALIDFRVTPTDIKRLREVLSSVRSLGLPASINHPTALCGGCSWGYGGDWEGMDSVEIWNGDWDGTDEAALKLWDTLLQKGSRITAIGSSDSHVPPTDKKPGSNPSIGTPTTFIGANSLKQSGIFAGLRSRRVFIAENPGQFISFTSGRSGIGGQIEVKKNENPTFSISVKNFPSGSTIKLISGKGILREETIDKDTFSRDITVELLNNSYVRLEVRHKNNKMLAFTNPIFIRVKQ